MKTKAEIENLIFENQSKASDIDVNMMQLEVIQVAVYKLMDHIDEMEHKNYFDNVYIAKRCLKEIQDKVRLIDMAFNPLFKEMNERVSTLNDIASELYELFKKKNERHNINHVLGWNYHAMENNIKMFIKEVGREPESFEEAATYITKMVRKAIEKIEAEEQKKKADAGNID